MLASSSEIITLLGENFYSAYIFRHPFIYFLDFISKYLFLMSGLLRKFVLPCWKNWDLNLSLEWGWAMTGFLFKETYLIICLWNILNHLCGPVQLGPLFAVVWSSENKKKTVESKLCRKTQFFI